VSGRDRRIDAAARRLEAVGPQPAGYAVEPFAGSILDALDAAGLIGASWAAWRVFWKAIAALPMDDADRALFQRCTGREASPVAPVREAWVIVGRRGGKTRNAALGATFTACRRDWRAVLAPGERAVVPIIAADRKQARQALGYVRGLAQLPAFAPLAHELVFYLAAARSAAVTISTSPLYSMETLPKKVISNSPASWASSRMGDKNSDCAPITGGDGRCLRRCT